eukprot:gene3189-3993_t
MFNVYLPDLIKIVSDYGIIASCSKICGYLNKTVETDLCEALCDLVGVGSFWKIFTLDDLNPIYACQLVTACQTPKYPAANFITTVISPNSGPAGSTFSITINFTVINATGTGQFAYEVYYVENQSKYIYSQTFEGYQPGNFAITMPFSTSSNTTFSPGVYPVQVFMCSSVCGTHTPYSSFLNSTYSQFSITHPNPTSTPSTPTPSPTEHKRISVKSIKFIGELKGHNDRISSLCFHEWIDHYCITGSDDKTVRLWDTETMSCVSYHDVHKSPVSLVASSPIIPELIVSSDKSGKLVVWSTSNNQIKVHSPLSGLANSTITVMAFSPFDPDMIAIGYLTGNIIIFDIIKGVVVTKLSAHTSEIISIVWINFESSSSTDDNNNNSIENTKSSKQYCLATSSKDKTIKIWKRIGFSLEDGFQIMNQLNPQKYTGAANTSSGGGNDKFSKSWITLSWSKDYPQYLFSSSLSGDLLYWDLKSGSNKIQGERFQSAGHQRSIFNITICPPTTTTTTKKNNELESKNFKIITTSLDRQIIGWEGFKMKWKISGIGGFVYSLDSCSFNPHSIFIGSGDNSIKIWSPMENPNDSYESKNLWKGIQSKVTAIAINQQDPNLIGFGMDDGRIGVYNINNRMANIMPGSHKNEIYEVSWSGIDNKLYSVGNNEIYEWNTNNIHSSFVNLNQYIPIQQGKSQRTEVSWLSEQFLSIGNNDGSIEIFDTKFKPLAKIREHKKLVNRIRWSPHQSRPNEYILASASTDKSVIIYKFFVKESLDGENLKISYELSVVTKLIGHKGNVCGLCWSPHDLDLIASSSVDGTAQVWKISSSEGISNLRGHDGRLFTVCWSHLEPEIIFTGGEDQTVRMWNYLDQPFKLPPENQKQVKLKPITPQTTSVESPSPTTPILDESIKTENSQLSTPLKSPVIESTPEGKSTSTTASKKSKNILPVLKSLPNIKDLSSSVLTVANYHHSNETTQDPSLLNQTDILFSNNDKLIERAIEKEAADHLASSSIQTANIENYFSISMWNGNIRGALSQIVKQGRLTPNIVALSVQGGKELWESVCHLYAQQLISTGDFNMAVSYLLAIGKVVEAIQVYTKTNQFHEAILLAKSRLPSNHPIIQQIFLDWISQSDLNELQVVKCLLAAGQPQNAIDLLKNSSKNKSLITELENVYK